MKANTPGAKLPQIHELTGNSVGGTDMCKNRESALKTLNTAKNIEIDHKKAGYVYMIKEKTTKLVHPDKVAANEANGFKLLKKVK